jgi:amino acid transporter
MTPIAETPTATQPKLRRTLATWAAISLSVAAMGASLAININPQGAGATVGRAVPLTFILATVGVLLVAYGFARVCSRLSHAGSVFGLTGITIGPRAGVVAGWSLLGAYLSFMLTTSMTAGIFGAEFLRGIGLYETTPGIVPWIIALVAVGIATLLAISPVKKSMATLLWVEIVTTAVIVVIAAVVVFRVTAGNAPGGQRFTLDMFTVPPEISTSTLFLGIVFGFLSFAGFEAAAALGEESKRPLEFIPKAVLSAVLVGVVFYVFVTFALSIGFGVAGAGKWASDPTAYDTIVTHYVGRGLATVVDCAVALDAFVASLAATVLVSRTMFAMGREGGLPRAFAWTHPKYKTPWMGVIASIALTIVLVTWLAYFTYDPLTYFAFMATAATFLLLGTYMLVAGAGLRYFWREKRAQATRYNLLLDLIAPAVAIGICGLTVYWSIYPVPPHPLNEAPWLALGWLVLGLAVLAWMRYRSPATVGNFGRILGDEAAAAEPAPAEAPPVVALQ